MGIKKRTRSIYDIAISFTEMDDLIAKALYKALRRKGLKVFYYKKTHQTAEDLLELTRRVYSSGCHYGLVIQSKNYLEGTYPRKELKALTNSRDRRGGHVKGIFIVEVDKIFLPGISPSIVRSKWRGNAKTIAKEIKAQIPRSGNLLWRIILLIILTIVGIWATAYYGQLLT